MRRTRGEEPGALTGGQEGLHAVYVNLVAEEASPLAREPPSDPAGDEAVCPSKGKKAPNHMAGGLASCVPNPQRKVCGVAIGIIWCKALSFKSQKEDSRLQKCAHSFKILKFQILKERFESPHRLGCVFWSIAKHRRKRRNVRLVFRLSSYKQTAQA